MWPFTSDSPSQTDAAPPSACPVDHETRQQWLEQNPSAPSSARPAGHSPPDQARPSLVTRLSTDREVSSIPRWLPPASTSTATSTSAPPLARSDESVPPSACPAHASNASSGSTTEDAEARSLNSAEAAAIVPSETNWVYPSPSSFYTALERKNRNPNPKDMDIVVPIHNAVNERVWQQVLEWERLAMGLAPGQDTGVKLVSFMGRPKQMSPRARWKSFIGYTAPFDRHDWIIDRPVQPPTGSSPSASDSPAPSAPDSIRVRYVIDFYTGRGANLLASVPPAPSNPTGTAPSSTSTSSNAPSDASRSPPSPEEPFSMPNLAFFIDCRPALDGWEGVRMRFNKYWGLGSTAPGGGQTSNGR
ncbi:hypothetical protein JCM10212_004110 [Sporobolomyces blumeae]